MLLINMIATSGTVFLSRKLAMFRASTHKSEEIEKSNVASCVCQSSKASASFLSRITRTLRFITTVKYLGY